MEKNSAREKRIFELWKDGYKIAEIANLTGYPQSSVGYYTKRFKERQRKGNNKGLSLDEALRTQSATIFTGDGQLGKILDAIPPSPTGIYDIGEMKLKLREMAAETKETPIIRREESVEINVVRKAAIDIFRDILQKIFTQLMEQGKYTQAKDFCDALLSYSTLSQRLVDIKEGRKKIRLRDYRVLESVFKPEKTGNEKSLSQ
jgi:hypothetical protein